MNAILRWVFPVVAVCGLVGAPQVARADVVDRDAPAAVSHPRDRWERERFERDRFERERREHERACEHAAREGASSWRLRAMGCYAR